MTIARASELPIMLVNDLVVAGHPLGRSATAIEGELTERADALRGGGTWMGGVTPEFDAHARPVERDDDGRWWWSPTDRSSASSTGTIAGRVTAGSGFIRCVYEREVTPVGPPTAPRAAEFWSFLDSELATRTGGLTAAVQR
jgi:hypothetical protein